ncbi:MAG: CBS domain-containing protein, partial [Bacteroidales bacterium]|nr:CBS domain-containing protein [Bacteroidales bacterium]
CYTTLYPIAFITSHFSKRVIRLWGNGAQVAETEQDFGRADISNFIEENFDTKEGEDSESINENDFKLFQNVLDFSKVKLRECIVPRTEIVAVEMNESLDVLMQKFIESGYSKVLIYDDNIDNIIGYIHSFDFFQKPKELKSHIREVSIVPESMPANKLMEIFMQQKLSIAVVVDEFGGTAGIVTLEDIIEEIFGEIEDEHDRSEYISKKIAPNEYMFSARLEIDYINEEFDLKLPESDEYETIAGFILSRSGSFPKVNDEIKIDQYCFKIINAIPTKIELVKLTLNTNGEND